MSGSGWTITKLANLKNGECQLSEHGAGFMSWLEGVSTGHDRVVIRTARIWPHTNLTVTGTVHRLVESLTGSSMINV